MRSTATRSSPRSPATRTSWGKGVSFSTSAKLACLAADGKLAPGEAWRQESIIGSVFEARYAEREAAAGDAGTSARTIVPTITGHAHIMAEGRLCFDAADPFAWGIRTA